MTIKRREVIGGCTLYLGDSMLITESLGLQETIISDPPYGMGFQSNHREVKHNKIANDEGLDALKWACDLPFLYSKYIFCRWDNLPDVPKPKSCITWVKNNWSMGDLNHEHARQTEIALFYNGKQHSFGKGRPSDVVYADRTGNNFHPTEKPVSLIMQFIGWTHGVVFDPFMGSASTLVACAKLGRKGIGIELDPDYFDIACRRVEDAYRQTDLFIEPPAPRPEQYHLITE